VRRSVLLCLIFVAVLAGLILGRLVAVDAWPLFAASIALIALRRPRLVAAGLIIAALGLGLWRAGVTRIADDSLSRLIGTKVTVTGLVADDPGTTSSGGASFKLDHLVIAGRKVGGQLPVYMQRVNLHRGWQVSAAGTIKPGFGNAPVELSYPTLRVTSTQQSLLERWRQRFFAGMKTALPEPAASFGLGLLVGIRSLIPKDLQAQLALVGLSHLVAVSGYNLTIIVRATERLLGRLGRGVTLAGSLWLIGLFVVAAGGGASIVRAALVSTLSLLAGFYGRRFQPLVLILLAAAATALYHPAYLTDYGWLLSFTAFFGVMVLAPAVIARLRREPNWLVSLLIETVCAQLLTLPLIAYGFGQLSIISPLANLIELPLVPLAMLLSLVAGLAGIFAPAFAGWLAWPATLLLNFMLWVVHQLAALPWAGRSLTLGLSAMLGIYGLISAVTVVLIRRRQPALRLQFELKATTVSG
jgi:competence protein ComEC